MSDSNIKANLSGFTTADGELPFTSSGVGSSEKSSTLGDITHDAFWIALLIDQVDKGVITAIHQFNRRTNRCEVQVDLVCDPVTVGIGQGVVNTRLRQGAVVLELFTP